MESLRDRIIRHEGKVRVVYDDANGAPIVPGYTVKGNPTIGVGTLLSAPGLSDLAIFYLLDLELANAKTQLIQNLPWADNLDTVRQEVLIEMVYQLGINRLLIFNKALTAMQNSDWPTASKEMLNSAWHKQTPGRCEELANLMLYGQS